MAAYIGDKLTEADAEKIAEFEARVDPNDGEAVALLGEMKAQLKKVSSPAPLPKSCRCMTYTVG